MNNNVPRRVLGIILLTYALAFAYFVVLSIATFKSTVVLAAYYWPWVWNRSLIDFIETLIPVQCTAVLVAHSLLPTLRARGRARSGDAQAQFEPFYRLISSTLVLFLVLTLAFTALTEAVRPLLYVRQDNLLYQTTTARMFLSDYQSAFSEGRLADAKYYIDSYLTLVPSDDAARTKRDQVTIAIEQQIPKLHPAGAESSYGPVENASVASLMTMAQSYLDRRDYASARYYATLATDVEPDNARAAAIATQALANLSRVAPSPAERDRQYFFTMKSKGRSALEEGDPIDAYYVFKTLSASHPDDPDVVTYLGRSVEQLSKFAFFQEETSPIAPIPGIRDILFASRVDESTRQVVFFQRMVDSPSGVYFFGVEIIRFTVKGDVVFHVTAPYGKLIGSSLSMYCIGKERRLSYLPTALAGALPSAWEYRVPLPASAGELSQLGLESATFSKAGLPRLLQLSGTLERFGYLGEPVQIELIRRALAPFSFLILSIVAIGVGWSFRAPSGRPRVVGYLLTPAFPFVIAALTEAYLYAGKLLFGFVLTEFGQWPAYITFLAVQFALLIAALFYVAGRSAVVMRE